MVFVHKHSRGRAGIGIRQKKYTTVPQKIQEHICNRSNYLWNNAPCFLLTDTNVSERPATSIFNVEATKGSQQARNEAQRLSCHEGSRLLGNVLANLMFF
jgi:hypothetical protein